MVWQLRYRPARVSERQLAIYCPTKQEAIITADRLTREGRVLLDSKPRRVTVHADAREGLCSSLNELAENGFLLWE